MLQKAIKWQGYSFYQFWFISEKPTEGEGNITPIQD